MKLLVFLTLCGLLSCSLPWFNCGQYLGGMENGLDGWPGMITFANYMFILLFSINSITTKTQPNRLLSDISIIIGLLSFVLLSFMILTGWILCDIRFGLVVALVFQLTTLICMIIVLKD